VRKATSEANPAPPTDGTSFVVMSEHDRPLNPKGAALPDPDDASRTGPVSLSVDVRSAEIDRSYGIYDALPLETEDEWGNPAAFLNAVGST